MRPTKKYINDLTYKIIGAAIEVHRELGPGLLESVYHRCLMKEFYLAGLEFKSELAVPIHYKEEHFDTYLRCDFLVEDQIVVEIKSVHAFAPVFSAQLLTYLRLLKKPKGVLLNFNVINIFKEGQKTLVTDSFRNLTEE